MLAVELEVRQKCMVTETYGAKVNSNLNQQQSEFTTQIQQQLRVMSPPPGPA